MKRGLTLIEVMITIAVLAVGILVIVSSFSMNLRQSSQTRERLLADLVMENLVEEVLAHPYGNPPPKTWTKGEVEFPFIVEGKSQKNAFVQTVSIDSSSGNGSFLGQESGAGKLSDSVLLKVEWTEATGQGNSAVKRDLKLKMKVRREL